MLRLTDEELQLFGAAHPVVATPYFARLDEPGRRIALEVAHRALLAHGLPMSGDGGLLVPEQVVRLLELRSATTASLVLIRAAQAEHVRYVHDVGTAWLVEDVGPDGVHEFDLCVRERLPRLVTEVIVPEALPPGSGPAVTAAAEPWGKVDHRFDVTVWRSGEPRGPLLGVIVGTAGTWSTCAVPGDPEPTVFAPTDGPTVVAAVLALMAPQRVGTMVR